MAKEYNPQELEEIKKQFQKDYRTQNPIKAKIITLFVSSVMIMFYATVIFVFVSILFAIIKWSINVWL